MTHTPEALIGSVLLTTIGISGWLSDKDWDRMIGPWGGLLISVAMVGILLRHSAKRIAKEDARVAEDKLDRERRHKESLDAMKETHGRYETLHSRAMDAQLETAKALLKMSHSCELLHNEIKSRPCQKE